MLALKKYSWPTDSNLSWQQVLQSLCYTGDWFCSGKCKDIHHALRERVEQGAVDLGDDYQWQLLHGKDGTTSTTWQLKGCQDILEESFDPIIDQISKQNLVKGMVYSEQQGEWDHSGMFAAVLKYKVEILVLNLQSWIKWLKNALFTLLMYMTVNHKSLFLRQICFRTLSESCKVKYKNNRLRIHKWLCTYLPWSKAWRSIIHSYTSFCHAYRDSCIVSWTESGIRISEGNSSISRY